MSEVPLGTWIDGAPGHSFPVDDRGLHYGDGVFETILVRAGQPRFLESHLARLELGCARLAIRFDALSSLRAEISRAVGNAPPLAVLKIIVTRGSAQRRGYAPTGTEHARRMISLWPAAAPVTRAAGVDLRIAAVTLADQPALAGIKHLNRLENVLAAAAAAHDGGFDALLLDTAGHVVSGAMSNVFMVKAGRLHTPLVDRCGVAGVTRGIVMRECVRLALAVEQRRCTLAELLAADEVFITNARIGVVPVRRVGEHVFSMQAVTLKVARHIEALDA